MRKHSPLLKAWSLSPLVIKDRLYDLSWYLKCTAEKRLLVRRDVSRRIRLPCWAQKRFTPFIIKDGSRKRKKESGREREIGFLICTLGAFWIISLDHCYEEVKQSTLRINQKHPRFSDISLRQDVKYCIKIGNSGREKKSSKDESHKTHSNFNV